MKKLAYSIAVLASMVSVAQAEENSYWGINLGYSTAQLDKNQATSELVKKSAFSQFLQTKTDNDKGKLGGKIYFGYEFHPNFAIEAGYTYLNKAQTKLTFSTPTEPGRAIGNATATANLHAIPVAVVFKAPVGEQFSLFGKLGGAALISKYHFNENITDVKESKLYHSSESNKKRTFVPVFGAGFEVGLNKQLVLRAEYENFGRPKIDKQNTKIKRLDMFSIGLRSNFN